MAVPALALLPSGCSPAPACSVGEALCGDYCIDVTSDSNNCGGCGLVCANGSVCTSGSCVVSTAFPNLGSPGGPVPPNTSPTYNISDGVPTTLAIGTEAGYGITANTGGSFRLVWTGDGGTSGSYREFFGSVYTLGHFTSLVPGCNAGACPIQSDDMITTAQPLSSGGERVDFDSVSADTLSGFDFVIDTEPAYFDFFIDGTHYPMLVFFPAADNGGAISNVTAFPFGLVTQ